MNIVGIGLRGFAASANGLPIVNMTKFHHIPSDWILSDDLRRWTQAKGLSDKTIEDELESFLDHEYRIAKSRPDACWRNWVKNGIRWGRIDTTNRAYRQPEEISAEQKQIDAGRAVIQMDQYRKSG